MWLSVTGAAAAAPPQTSFSNRLADHGIGWRLDSTHYYQGLVSGTGSRDWDYGGRLDGYLNLDTGKLGLWSGGLVRVHGEYFYGPLDANLGGVGVPSNLGVRLPNPGTPEDPAITSLHLVQQLGNGRSLIAGVINTVDLLEGHPFYGGGGLLRFFNLAFAAPANGLQPPVIVGAVASIPRPSLSWTFMLFDSNDRTRGGWFDHLFEDVNLSVSARRGFELAGRTSSVTLTGIYSTQNAADLGNILLPPDLQTGEKDDSWHASLQFEHTLRERERPGSGFGFYMKLGVSDGNPNPYQAFMTIGIGGKSLFAGRPEDSFGFGYFYYNFSDALQSAVDPLVQFDDEQGVELFYDFFVADWLRVAADVQYTDPATGTDDDALSAGLRVRFTFQ